MGLLGIWISRAITEFSIGIAYDVFICMADIEDVIKKHLERMAKIEDNEANQEMKEGEQN